METAAAGGAGGAGRVSALPGTTIGASLETATPLTLWIGKAGEESATPPPINAMAGSAAYNLRQVTLILSTRLLSDMSLPRTNSGFDRYRQLTCTIRILVRRPAFG